MDKKVILGGGVGALVTLVFALGILLFLEGLHTGFLSSGSNMVISLLIILLAPIAGGFLAGMISRSKPRQAGMMTGLAAGCLIFAAWIVVTGFSFETLLSGLVILFVWVVMARAASGFAPPKR